MDTRPYEPAFPRDGNGADGLTKREEFAKAAMQGFSSNPDFTRESVEDTGILAVRQADALIAALNRTQPMDGAEPTKETDHA